jgi:hypothetical protein
MANTKKFVANNFSVDVSGLKQQATSRKRQKPQATSFKPQATSFKLQATSSKLQDSQALIKFYVTGSKGLG